MKIKLQSPSIEVILLSIFLLVISGCSSDVHILSREEKMVPGHYDLYREYCHLDTSDHSGNAVLASLVGEYQRSLTFAAAHNFMDFERNSEEATDILKEIFTGYETAGAVEYISEQSEGYHFTLINEAHYSSVNRAFTASLLRPLWDRGYRYLALEALGYNDPGLTNRKYPTDQSGFYLRESTFANFVREALEIGYQLIPYETRIFGKGGTHRDHQQAKNILSQTWENDKQGKVLIHVGYGHLNEWGDDSYKPMGFRLIEITGQEIFTVDQQTMLPLDAETKMHSYYQFALKNYAIDRPVVFVNSDRQILVDGINSQMVDAQVYHPMHGFTHNRPDWLVKDDKLLRKLPDDFSVFRGMLLQLTPLDEGESAVPSDQFVIAEENYVIAKTGLYRMEIINCEGSMVAVYEIKVG